MSQTTLALRWATDAPAANHVRPTDRTRPAAHARTYASGTPVNRRDPEQVYTRLPNGRVSEVGRFAAPIHSVILQVGKDALH